MQNNYQSGTAKQKSTHDINKNTILQICQISNIQQMIINYNLDGIITCCSCGDANMVGNGLSTDDTVNYFKYCY